MQHKNVNSTITGFTFERVVGNKIIFFSTWHFEFIEIIGQGNRETYLTGKRKLKANINST